MEHILEIPGLGDIIFKDLSMNDLAHLRVTRSLRTLVSHHVGKLMESYDRSLKKRCNRILDTPRVTTDETVWEISVDPGECIYSTPYKCVYNYYHTLVKLSFLCPEKQVFLEEVISYLQSKTQFTWGYEYVLWEEYYRAQTFTKTTKSLYDIVASLHLNTFGKTVSAQSLKYLENKLLPVTIE
jgi:hypothetical protein